jgi:O-antigen ligase
MTALFLIVPKAPNLLLFLVFAYFLTLSIDLLHVPLFLFKCKITHLIAPLLFFLLLIKQQRFVIPKSILWSSGLIFSSLVLSAVLGTDLARSSGYIAVFIFSFLFYFLLPFNLIRLFDREQILKLYFLSFICIGVYALLQVVLSCVGIYDPFAVQSIGSLVRGQALTYEPSYFALYMIPFAMFHNAKYFLQKKGSLLPLLSINLLLLVSTSTGAFFSYFIFFCVALALKFPFLRILRFVGFFIGSLGGLAWLFPEVFLHSFLKFFYVGFFNHGSFVERWAGLARCWGLFLEHPILGVGVGGVGTALYQQHFFGTDRVHLSEISLSQLEAFDPTIVLTEILASLGIVGVIALTLFLIQSYRMLKKALALTELTDDERVVLRALLCSAIVMLIALQFNQGLFRPYIWVHLAICLGYTNNLFFGRRGVGLR